MEVADDILADVNSMTDYASDDLAIRRPQLPQQSYTILSEADIRLRQEEDITRISSVLCISRADAGILLRHCKWNVTKVHDEWFAEEEKVRKTVGLLQNPVVEFPNASELTCGICSTTFPKDDIYATACGHPFCRSCWAGHISTAVNDGPGCLMLQCPDPTCGAAVGEDMISVLATEDDREKYARYFLRSYIEDGIWKVKWCPAPGCDCAVEFALDSGSYDVTCLCSYSFCWKCTEEAHRPLDCGTVSNWISENTTVFKDTDWILLDSKKCPKCKSPIKKRQGSMRTTCTLPCTFEFCWICLGPWTRHDTCNSYKTATQLGSYDESEKLLAKFSLKRYSHFYERWAANESFRQKATADLQQIQCHCQQDSPLMFMLEAWSHIVEYRRVLKWSYAYGYFLPEHEHTKRPLFEYLQGEAEMNLDQLHHCAEKVQKQLCIYLASAMPLRNLNKFRAEVEGLTRKTGIYFARLVEALENGTSDVEPSGAYNCTEHLRALGLGSSREVRTGTVDFSYVKFSEPRWEIDDFWPCDRCTYANLFAFSSCQMCVEPTD